MITSNLIRLVILSVCLLGICESTVSGDSTQKHCNDINPEKTETDCSSGENWNGKMYESGHFVKTLGGIQMPKLIYGTAWKKERTAELVVQAVRAGFRGVDTACQPKHYHEPGVGAALKILANEDGIKRESLFIQTKYTSVDGQDPKNIPYDPKQELPITVKQSLKASLQNLNTTYIDSLVMHSPMRTHRDTMEVTKDFKGKPEVLVTI